MNRIRNKGSDSDQSSVRSFRSGRSVPRNKTMADGSDWPPPPAAAETEPKVRKFGSSKASSVRSYRMDDDDDEEKDLHAFTAPPRKVGGSNSKASSIRSYRMDDDDQRDVFTPKVVGSSRKASSIRSYRLDDDDDDQRDGFTPKVVGSSRKASSIRSYRMDDDDDDQRDGFIPKVVGSSRKASSIRSYRMDDDDNDQRDGFIPKVVGNSRKASSIRSYRMDDDDYQRDVFTPKVGGSSRKASSIRSYRMDDDDYQRDVFTPKVGGSSRKASSIHSYRMDEDDDNEEDITPRVSMGSYARNTTTPRIGQNSIYSDSYAALRIADNTNNTHTPIRIAAADNSQLNNNNSSKAFVGEDEDVNTDPYVALKIAGSGRHSGADYGDILYDSNGSSESEEYVNSSDEGGGESGSEEDNDDEFITPSNARVSVAGSESGGQARDGGYARVSVAGSSADYGKHVGRGYARVSVAGSESDHANDGGEKLQGYARVSAPASDAAVYASEGDHGNGNYPKVSVANSEIYHGQDVYARLSVAGSAAEPPRVSSMGSEADHGKHGYAQIYASGSETELGNGVDKEVSGHETLPVVEDKVDKIAVEKQDKDEVAEDKEYVAYLELSPEFQAKLQYRVRVVLISPRFELKNRKLSEFFDIFRSKFGVNDEEGSFCFSSVPSLCRAMPSVIQRRQLGDTEELILVDSAENRRAVSGIRSGLRRIVYDALKSVPEELTCAELEGRCSELLGRPLVEVLGEHGYDTPTVESLVKDMPDITCFKEAGLESRVCLCTGAEDPALTDGLLVRSFSVLTTPKAATPNGVISHVEDAEELAKGFGDLKFGSTVTLRSLRNEFGRPEGFSPPSVSSLENEYLQIRLRMRILLAFHNSGRGVEAREVPEIYAKIFDQSLNLEGSGFKSITELARHWQDIFLLQEPKPGWVCLVPSQANRRILNTLRTGLRSSVFSVLVETYPEGLEPLDFLHRLQEGMAGELWEVLEATGYVCSDAEKADSILSSSSSSDFQLVDFEEICLLLDDMMDFVRLGSNEDGSAVVKLRNGEVPLVDLLDCKLNESDMGSFDELFVNLMMIAVDVNIDPNVAEDGSSGNDGFINVGHVQSLVKSFEGSGGLRSAHSQESETLRMKHELRLILGSPDYSENGVPLNELSNVYKSRTGQELGSKSKVRSLLRSMPDIVSKDSLASDVVRLCKTLKNLRILSTTRAGLRQVLFWALVKNPGGIWGNLLEGWFTDFSGVSLAATLQMHGYEMSKSRPFFPVQAFLRDMSDLLQRKAAPLEVYTWAGEVKDPVHNDASLLGLSELVIQYDPLQFNLENGYKREAGPVEKIEYESVLKEDEGFKESCLVNGAVLEKSPMKEGKGDAMAGWEEGHSSNTSTKEDESDRESRLDQGVVDQPAVEQEKGGKEIHHMESGGELGSGETEGLVGQKLIVESKSVGELDRGDTEQPLGQEGIVERKEDLGKVFDVPSNDHHTYREEHSHSDGKDEPCSGEREQAPEEDESHLPQIESRSTSEEHAQLPVEEHGPTVVLGERHPDSNGEDGPGSGENEQAAAEEDESHVPRIKVEPTSDSYAQLRVAQKGPKVKLDEEYSDSDGGEEGPDSDENEEAADEDESVVPRIGRGQLTSTSESYAQLRVTGKGPKVNLDEWQFTDSEEEAEDSGEEDEEEDVEEEDEEEEEYDEEGEEEDEDEDEDQAGDGEEKAKTANTTQEQGQTLPTNSNVGPKAKETGKDANRARVLPNKGIPWK
ncbi:unnamed protein product [Calypogeia fissa]